MMVSDTRYQLPLFSMIDYESVEKHLEKMASKGWEIEDAGRFLWKYKRTIPKAKKYAVVFSQDSSDYSPYPTESQQFLKEMCEQSGWKKAAEWNRMQIFSCDDRKQELETDETVRLNSIRRAMKKSFIPCWTIAMVGMFFLALQNIVKLHFGNPQDESGTLWAIFITLYVALASVAVLTNYRLWLHMSERALTQGGKCVSAKWHSRLQYGLCAGALILAGIYFTTGADSPGPGSLAYSLVYVSVLILIVALVDLFANYLKSKSVSKTTNVICSSAVCVAFMILAMFLLKAAQEMPLIL